MSNPYCRAEAAEGATEERERLILEHLPQVRLIARRIRDRLPENVSVEDLVSAGIVGLIAAVDQYDPAHNVKLKTYAEHKIRGAILDSLRVSIGRRGRDGKRPNRSRWPFRGRSKGCITSRAKTTSRPRWASSWRNITNG